MKTVFNGFSKHEKRKGDASKKSMKPGRKEADMGNLGQVPGVKVMKRKRY